TQTAGSQERDVRAPGHGKNARGVSFEGECLLPPREIPDLQFTGKIAPALANPASRGQQPAIRAEGDGRDRPAVPLQDGALLAGSPVPEGNDAPTSDGHEVAARADRHAGDATRLPREAGSFLAGDEVPELDGGTAGRGENVAASRNRDGANRFARAQRHQLSPGAGIPQLDTGVRTPGDQNLAVGGESNRGDRHAVC